MATLKDHNQKDPLNDLYASSAAHIFTLQLVENKERQTTTKPDLD